MKPHGWMHREVLQYPYCYSLKGDFFILNDALHPLSFEAGTGTAGSAIYLEDASLAKLLAFFQAKGLAQLKQEDWAEAWYQDWIDYQTHHQLYARLLSPGQYSSLGEHFDLLRLVRFLEACGYCSPSHGYSLHVSFLGLFPILQSDSDALKREAIAHLERGGLLAFGVSEKAHGSDLFGNEFTLTAAADGNFLASGKKYYIGNAQAAGMISVLARKESAGAKKAPFVYFVLRPTEQLPLKEVRKIRTMGVRSAFVAEFAVENHPVPATDLLSEGRDAWEALHGTINFGKFFLGFGSIGICEHALAEALEHMRTRALYNKPVLGMAHLRATVCMAYARLLAMKLYAYRALDYVHAASENERRFLLYVAVQKAQVSTEGVKVMNLLSECIGARGFESETFFEMALREAPLIPGLEGSTHLNFALTTQFLDGYLQATEVEVTSPPSLALQQTDRRENPYWWTRGDRQPRGVRFAEMQQPYAPLRSIAHIALFQEQAEAFRALLSEGLAAFNPASDTRLTQGLGRTFAIIAYAQLIAENCRLAAIPEELIAIIFQGLIDDFNQEALQLAGMLPLADSRRGCLLQSLRVPTTTQAAWQTVSETIAARYKPTS